MGCQWLAGLVSRVCLYDRRKIMIGSCDNSGGVVVGALVCGTECSGFTLCFDFFFFSLVEIFLSSCEPAEPFQHRASIACCKYDHELQKFND